MLLYGCITRTLTKHREKKLDGDYTRMLRAILNKSWRQHPTKQQLPPITKTIQVRPARHAGHLWRVRNELISYIHLRTLSNGRAKGGRPARTYIEQLCANTGYCFEDRPGAMNDRDGCWERVREIRAGSTTWWWWDKKNLSQNITNFVQLLNWCFMYWQDTIIRWNLGNLD